ncbi:hypothetical protein BGZ63DRAFT_508931 [Mariannaea sp. PMI_226]|nr:hypothetical protein BGZ63DRAFT_508931 [Mariannaea sp. PMI_226]
MKCIISGLEPDRCDRCVRLQRDCVYEPHRRGMWRRGQKETRLRDSQNQRSGGGDSPPAAVLPGTWENTAHLPMPLTGQSPKRGEREAFSGEHAITSGGSTLPLELSLSQTDINNTASFTSSFITHSEDTRGLSLSTVLDPEKVMLNTTTDSDKSLDNGAGEVLWARDDPIHLRLISRPSAQNLFEGFFKYFNCLVGLLDPQLYTFSYTRETSNLLFSTILAISARVFQPESYKSIRKHSETLLGRTLLACDTAVENIWAIVCMYHWKDVDDTRGYTLVGFAMRMAASAQWNRIRGGFMHGNEISSIPETEVQVRQRRDKHRVWLALGNLDRTSSFFTDRPLAAQTVNKEVVARSWLSLDKWTYPLGDGKAVGGFELTQIASPVYDLMMKSRQDVGTFSVALLEPFHTEMETLNTTLVEWGEYWRATFLKFPGSELFQVPLIYFFRDYMRLHFNSVLLHRLLTANHNNAFDTEVAKTIQLCFSCALSVLQQMIEMGKLDILYYLWDTAHLMMGYSAMMILKLLKQPIYLPSSSMHEALEVLAEVSHLYSTAASSLDTIESETFELLPGPAPANTPVGVQARLLGAVLSRLKSESHLLGGELSGKSTSNMPSIQNQCPFKFSGTSTMHEGMASTQFAKTTAELSRSTDFTAPQGIDLIIDSDFMDSWFMDVGLSSWDEQGIFIDAR